MPITYSQLRTLKADLEAKYSGLNALENIKSNRQVIEDDDDWGEEDEPGNKVKPAEPIKEIPSEDVKKNYKELAAYLGNFKNLTKHDNEIIENTKDIPITKIEGVYNELKIKIEIKPVAAKVPAQASGVIIQSEADKNAAKAAISALLNKKVENAPPVKPIIKASPPAKKWAPVTNTQAKADPIPASKINAAAPGTATVTANAAAPGAQPPPIVPEAPPAPGEPIVPIAPTAPDATNITAAVPGTSAAPGVADLSAPTAPNAPPLTEATTTPSTSAALGTPAAPQVPTAPETAAVTSDVPVPPPPPTNDQLPKELKNHSTQSTISSTTQPKPLTAAAAEATATVIPPTTPNVSSTTVPSAAAAPSVTSTTTSAAAAPLVGGTTTNQNIIEEIEKIQTNIAQLNAGTNQIARVAFIDNRYISDMEDFYNKYNPTLDFVKLTEESANLQEWQIFNEKVQKLQDSIMSLYNNKNKMSVPITDREQKNYDDALKAFLTAKNEVMLATPTIMKEYQKQTENEHKAQKNKKQTTNQVTAPLTEQGKDIGITLSGQGVLTKSANREPENVASKPSAPNRPPPAKPNGAPSNMTASASNPAAGSPTAQTSFTAPNVQHATNIPLAASAVKTVIAADASPQPPAQMATPDLSPSEIQSEKFKSAALNAEKQKANPNSGSTGKDATFISSVMREKNKITIKSEPLSKEEYLKVAKQTEEKFFKDLNNNSRDISDPKPRINQVEFLPNLTKGNGLKLEWPSGATMERKFVEDKGPPHLEITISQNSTPDQIADALKLNIAFQRQLTMDSNPGMVDKIIAGAIKAGLNIIQNDKNCQIKFVNSDIEKISNPDIRKELGLDPKPDTNSTLSSNRM